MLTFLGILSAAMPTLLGIAGSAIPQLVKWLENGQRYRHELEITKLRMEAAAQGLDQQIFLESIKAAGEEAKALREHDTAIPSHRYIDYLRASVRPVITYTFFFAFVGFKAVQAFIMFANGDPMTIITETVWDTYSHAIFGAVIGFWFGSRAFMHTNRQVRV